ncbi:serine hydrolase [Brevundimonas sp.]|uniref:serine hydrolase domain-containing protein n=1 Tax=Brevundimonas sp. TaxID=1871086 RepID=UPI003F70C3CC
MSRQGWNGAAIVLAVAATLGAGSAMAQQAAPAPAAVAPMVERLSSAQMAEIDRYVLAEMGRQRAPGLAVGVYLKGQPVYLKGYGLADVEWAAPMGPDTRMQTGSLGKQFVATAILKLVEEGKVALDAPVGRYFPEAPEGWAGVTVAHLLSHTSGIGSYDNPDLIGPGGPFDIRRDYTEDELATAIAALPNEFEVGTQWSYNNTNYVLLGILIHRVTGQAYGDYLRDAFFAPLGMSATRVISDTDVIPRRASGYEMRAGRLRNQAWVSPTFNSTADGTIYTTVEDMGRWENALVEGRVLSAASLEKMWTVFPLADGTPNPGNYGFGWKIDAMGRTRRIIHSGAWQGFTSNMTRYPDRGVTVVVFANLDGTANPALVARVVAGLVDPVVMPRQFPALPDDPARAERIRAFVAKAQDGGDLKDDFVEGSPYEYSPELAQGLQSALPPGWRDAPMTLVQHTPRPDGGGRFGYRVGPEGNTRLLTISLAPSGRVQGFGVAADPDSR